MVNNEEGGRGGVPAVVAPSVSVTLLFQVCEKVTFSYSFLLFLTLYRPPKQALLSNLVSHRGIFISFFSRDGGTGGVFALSSDMSLDME